MLQARPPMARSPSVATSSVGRTGMAELLYKTGGGEAWFGDAGTALREICEADSVDLIVTSPPFALLHQKEYGNQSQDDYVRWFQPFADEFWRVLKPTGSLVIDLGGSWEPGRPVKSLYAFELLISLCRRPNRQVPPCSGLLLVQPGPPSNAGGMGDGPTAAR